MLRADGLQLPLRFDGFADLLQAVGVKSPFGAEFEISGPVCHFGVRRGLREQATASGGAGDQFEECSLVHCPVRESIIYHSNLSFKSRDRRIGSSLADRIRQLHGGLRILPEWRIAFSTPRM